jgi:hypothetical protein
MKARVAQPPGCEVRQGRAAAPRGLDRPHEIRQGVVSHHVRREVRIAAIEDDPARAFRIGRRKQGCDGGAVRGADQCGASAAGRVHDGAHVLHPDPERRRLVRLDPVAQTRPAFVEQDEAAEGGEPAEQVAVARVLALDLKVRHEARDVDEVQRAVADDLVGDADIAILGVADFGRLHGSHRRCLQSRDGIAGRACTSSPSARPPTHCRKCRHPAQLLGFPTDRPVCIHNP